MLCYDVWTTKSSRAFGQTLLSSQAGPSVSLYFVRSIAKWISNELWTLPFCKLLTAAPRLVTS